MDLEQKIKEAKANFSACKVGIVECNEKIGILNARVEEIKREMFIFEGRMSAFAEMAEEREQQEKAQQKKNSKK